MRIGYYPGCCMDASAKQYSRSIQRAFALLDITLVEVPEWTCCGASSGHSMDEHFALELAGKNLSRAARHGLDIVAPCAMCFNRLRHAHKAFEDGHLEAEYGGEAEVRIRDIGSFLSSPEVLDRIRSRVKHPLDHLNVVTYYGCQVDRPPKVTGSKQHENPQSMDRVVEALGAKVLDWSYKTACCGGGLSIPRRDVVVHLAGKLFQRMQRTGARMIVVSCPMCQANLDLFQQDLRAAGVLKENVPVLYITDLINLALGDRRVLDFIRMNRVDSLPVIRELGMAP